MSSAEAISAKLTCAFDRLLLFNNATSPESIWKSVPPDPDCAVLARRPLTPDRPVLAGKTIAGAGGAVGARNPDFFFDDTIAWVCSSSSLTLELLQDSHRVVDTDCFQRKRHLIEIDIRRQTTVVVQPLHALQDLGFIVDRILKEAPKDASFTFNLNRM